jgi:hypothetical protein
MKLPPEWIALTLAKAISTDKHWVNFNEDHYRWRKLSIFVEQGLISRDDLPPEPVVADYPIS